MCNFCRLNFTFINLVKIHVVRILVFGSESGVVRFWAYPYEKNQWEELKVGDNLSSMKQSVLSSNIFATGGKENDLKLWDAVAKKCTFHAKNVRTIKLRS